MESKYVSFEKEMTNEEKLELAKEIFELDKEIKSSKHELATVSTTLKNSIKYKEDVKIELTEQFDNGIKEIEILAYPIKDYEKGRIVYLSIDDLEPIHQRDLTEEELELSIDDTEHYSYENIVQIKEDLIYSFLNDLKMESEEYINYNLPLKAFLLEIYKPNQVLQDALLELELNLSAIVEFGVYSSCCQLIAYTDKNDITRKSLFSNSKSIYVIESVNNIELGHSVIYEELVEDEGA